MMNWKRFALAFVAVLVVTAAGGFVIHGTLLQGDYAQYPNLLRTLDDQQAYFPYLLLNFFFQSLAIVWIYAFGVEDKPWLGQGLRFGVALWLLTSVSLYLTYYAVQPWSLDIVMKQIGYELGMRLAQGLAAAALYRK
jgi:hypothetical protein